MIKNNLIRLAAVLALIGFLCGTAVASSVYDTGNRIWDADENLSLTYTWTPESYSGFYYDLDSGEGSENLTIKLDSKTDRSIGAGDIEYVTRPISTSFEYNDWGSYHVIGFMAERYFAGYTADSDFADSEISMMADGQLAKVLIDTNDRKSYFPGSSITLNEGYVLTIVEIDLAGNNVLLSLKKDGVQVDQAIVAAGSTYVYETDIGSTDDVPMIAVNIQQVFRGTKTDAVFVDGIFQISEDYVSIETGDRFGRMEIKSVTEDEILMENRATVSFSRGSTINLMGQLNIGVADDTTLRFAPFVDMSQPGTYELRGTVASEESVWTPFNFEGFYYNLDEGIGTESLEVEQINTRTIPDERLVYTSSAEEVSFERSAWGKFEVIGFMAEKYFAGYPANVLTDTRVSLLDNGQLSKVLIDDDTRRSVFIGSTVVLEDGYSLRISEIDLAGNNVLISLRKDGTQIEQAIVSAGSTYVYETDIGGTDDVPVIAVRFDQVFRGTELDAVFIGGVFQISEDYITVDVGDRFGKMRVSSITPDEIVLKNDGSMTLTRGGTVSIMGDVKFRVAESNDVRYYPFVEVVTLPGDTLEIDMPEILAEGSAVDIVVKSRGTAVEDVSISFAGEVIGKTNEEGLLRYTPRETGTIEVKAEKAGFVSTSKSVQVVSADDMQFAVAIDVEPDVVYDGDTITITVTTAIDGGPMEDVEVFYSEVSIGNTDGDGQLSYTVEDPGVHRISVEPEGYLEAQYNLEVLEKDMMFELSNLVVSPREVQPDETVTINVDVENIGTTTHETEIELLVNDVVVDTKTVTLNPGEVRTLEFTHSEADPGEYTVQVGEENVTFTVEEPERRIPFVGIIGSIAALLVAVKLLRWNNQEK